MSVVILNEYSRRGSRIETIAMTPMPPSIANSIDGGVFTVRSSPLNKRMSITVTMLMVIT